MQRRQPFAFVSSLARGARILALCVGLAAVAIPSISRAEPSPLWPAGTVVVHSSGDGLSPAEKIAPSLLVEENDKRREPVALKLSDGWPDPAKPVIAIASRATLSQFHVSPGPEATKAIAELKPEGFYIGEDRTTRPGVTIWVIGADGRGAMFGAGKLLRLDRSRMMLDPRRPAEDQPPFALATSPAYPLRGHQIGYRNRANSWDMWTYDQFEQYFRDLILFGTNAFENIPFSDPSTNPEMKYSRRDLNKKYSELCQKYEMEHWVWTPVEFDLNNQEKRVAELARHEELYKDAARLDGVFFPGGDPGQNHANLVIPFLKDISTLLAKTHPAAKVWLSLQWFGPSDQAEVYAWLEKDKPDWFGGLVCGPSSPGLKETRAKLDKRYKLRNYPDITHTIRCQYPVPDFDRAFALTLGREGVNVRPVDSKLLHNSYAAWSDGFISYSDGVHDDVNKVVWSACAWDPNVDLRELLDEYSDQFGTPDADFILGLENNWRAPAMENGAIEWGWLAALDQDADQKFDSMSWRDQMLRFRAAYDAYQRKRRAFEEATQKRADAVLVDAARLGSEAAMKQALEIANSGYREHDILGELGGGMIEYLADALYKSIQLQTSVPKYHASEPERGASMDFLNHPMNDRLYFELMFERIKALPTEEERVRELVALGSWTDPGPGGFYDDIGDVAHQPHVIRGEGYNTDPEFLRHATPEFTWANGGNDHRRLAWMDWQAIEGLRYDGLDPAAGYIVTATMNGALRGKLFANGVEAEALPDPPPPFTPPAGGKFGYNPTPHSWRIPKGAITDGALELRWEIIRPKTERKSQNTPVLRPEMAEVWLRKQ